MDQIYKLQPHRTMHLQGFDDYGAAAALWGASDTGFTVSGVFRDMADFAVLVLFQKDEPPPDRFGLDEVAQALHSAGQLIDPAPEAPLCQYLAGARRDLVPETHIAWIESHAWDDESPSPAQVYCWYWNETLGETVLYLAKVAEAAAMASAVANSMGLDEVVDYLRDPDKVAYYLNPA
jgi:hypothetical protein